MTRRYRMGNESLPRVDHDALLCAVADLEDAAVAYREKHGRFHTHSIGGHSAQDIARKAGVVGAARGGRGAVAGSWTGTMAPALRVTPGLRSLVKRGLLDSYDPFEARRIHYALTGAGAEHVRALRSR